MPRERKKVYPVPGGPAVEGEVVDIKKADEQWSTYELDDGSKIKVRMVIAEVTRLIGLYDNEGNPVYSTRGSPIQMVTAPSNLRKK